MFKLIKCPKCGASNPENAKFCNNCGVKLVEQKASINVETIRFLLIVSLMYVAISLFSQVLWTNYVLYTPFLANLAIGLIALLQLKNEAKRKLIWIILLIYSLIGLIPTVFVFYAGLTAGDGMFSAGVIIFLAMLVKLLLDRGMFLGE